MPSSERTCANIRNSFDADRSGHKRRGLLDTTGRNVLAKLVILIVKASTPLASSDNVPPVGGARSACAKRRRTARTRLKRLKRASLERSIWTDI